MRNGAPFVELPPAFRALQQRMLKTPGGDREMVEILALVLKHDEPAVLAAVASVELAQARLVDLTAGEVLKGAQFLFGDFAPYWRPMSVGSTR